MATRRDSPVEIHEVRKSHYQGRTISISALLPTPLVCLFEYHLPSALEIIKDRCTPASGNPLLRCPGVRVPVLLPLTLSLGIDAEAPFWLRRLAGSMTSSGGGLRAASRNSDMAPRVDWRAWKRFQSASSTSSFSTSPAWAGVVISTSPESAAFRFSTSGSVGGSDLQILFVRGFEGG
jgi:hypothetical protein